MPLKLSLEKFGLMIAADSMLGQRIGYPERHFVPSVQVNGFPCSLVQGVYISLCSTAPLNQGHQP